jgi:O-antigen/teichoic acid export membrane protein
VVRRHTRGRRFDDGAHLNVRRLSGLRLNVAANFAGRFWTAAIGFVFIPIYLRFLGVEAYGLVGFMATLQGLFGLLDLGLGATINRELARLSADRDRAQDQRDLLRTLEIGYWAVSVAVGAAIVSMAPWLAHHWIHPVQLTPTTVERAVRLMGLVIALQLPFSFYQGALLGLQRQVLMNGIMIATTTLRAVGTALVLWLYSPTVEAFFASQAIAAVAQTSAIVFAVWSVLAGVQAARPRIAWIAGSWRFAAAVAANSVVGIALTQLDKVILSRLLPLEQLGYYMLAGSIAAVIWQVIVPINQALYPRFAQLFAANEISTVTALYHRSCQAMTVLLVPFALTLVLFPSEVIQLWTRNARVAAGASSLAALLVAGTTLNGLASVPGYLQSAAGWPQLVLYTNALSAILLVPAVVFAATRYGAIGAAAVWLVLNIGYVAFNVPIMHTRLLKGEQRRWYITDVGLPTAAALAAGALVRLTPAASGPPLVSALRIAVMWLACTLAAALVAPEVRRALTSNSQARRLPLARLP